MTDPTHTRYRIPSVPITRLFEEPDGRWFVHFAGSWESLCMGREKPDFNVGDKVDITIERSADAH